jgi:uncharacterized membrane protein
VSESHPGGTKDAPRLSDHALEQVIGRLLQIGVLVAALVVVVGGIALLSRYGGMPADFRSFRSEPSVLSTLGGIVRGAYHLDSHAIVQLGLVLLIATPIMRVGLTLIAFWWQRDRLYMSITAFVLMLLVYSLFWGRA